MNNFRRQQPSVKILGIDPGPTQSAFVLWDGAVVLKKGILPNDELASLLADTPAAGVHLCIEMIGHYGTGMPAGKAIFDTCVWIGRFIECWGSSRKYELLLRATIKTHLCGSAKAKDGNVRQSLIDRFGAPGTKKAPGMTYGISTHLWSAFAVAVCAHDRLSIGVAA